MKFSVFRIIGVPGKSTGKLHLSWEKPWFPEDVSLNQAIDRIVQMFRVVQYDLVTVFVCQLV